MDFEPNLDMKPIGTNDTLFGDISKRFLIGKEEYLINDAVILHLKKCSPKVFWLLQ